MRRFLLTVRNGLAALVAVAGIGAAHAQAPLTIHYQGFLTTPAGQPVDGTVMLQARLYAVAVGGATIWQETHPSVSVSKGVFAVALGSNQPLDDDLFSGPRWISVQVNADAEMQRQPLAAVPYAVVARRAQALSGSAVVPGSQIEPGTITNEQMSTAAAITPDRIAMPGAFLTGRISGLLSNYADVYAAASGPSTATDFAGTVETLSPGFACTAANLRVRLTSPPGLGAGRQFRLLVDGAATAVQCTILDFASVCDTGGAAAAVPPGARISIQVTSAFASPASALFGWTCR